MITKKEIKDNLIEIFEENGYNCINNSVLYDEIESLAFISIIIKIESYFNITIPDNYLDINIILSLDLISEVIFEQLNIGGNMQ